MKNPLNNITRENSWKILAILVLSVVIIELSYLAAVFGSGIVIVIKTHIEFQNGRRIYLLAHQAMKVGIHQIEYMLTMTLIQNQTMGTATYINMIMQISSCYHINQMT